MTRIRRTGLLDRSVQRRDARLYLVATEDTYAGEQYFAALQQNGVVDARRVKVHVITTPEGSGRSSPRAVLARLRDFEAGLLPMDERWLSLDRDRWPERLLGEVCREALQAGWFMAVSHPCFEAWLLLHLCDEVPDQARGCEEALRTLLGSYSKTNLPCKPWTLPTVREAIERARARDTAPADRWPRQPGSHLYRLVERLLPA